MKYYSSEKFYSYEDLTYYSIKTLWKVSIFSIVKQLYESILMYPKFWLILSIIPFFSLIRYLILSQILSNNP